MMSVNTECTPTECVKNKQRSSDLRKLDNSQDGGYETDLSTSLMETTISDSDMCFKDLVVERNCTRNGNEEEYIPDTCKSEDCDSESETDREVAELLGHSLKIRNTHRMSCGKHEQIQRPSAPLPDAAMCCGGMDYRTLCARTKAEKQSLDYLPCKMCRHNRLASICKLCSGYYFRPINRGETSGSCSETPDSGAFAASSDANHQGLSRVTNANPVVRQQSEHIVSTGALPDLIPSETSRSKSLPDIVSLRRHHENEMGRELRRIGDEFETAFRERNARKVQTISWNVFNCSLTLHLSGYLNTIKRVLSPEPSQSVENR